MASLLGAKMLFLIRLGYDVMPIKYDQVLSNMVSKIRYINLFFHNNSIPKIKNIDYQLFGVNLCQINVFGHQY